MVFFHCAHIIYHNHFHVFSRFISPHFAHFCRWDLLLLYRLDFSTVRSLSRGLIRLVEIGSFKNIPKSKSNRKSDAHKKKRKKLRLWDVLTTNLVTNNKQLDIFNLIHTFNQFFFNDRFFNEFCIFIAFYLNSI